eukprot:scpid58316/ scgid14153/ 
MYKIDDKTDTWKDIYSERTGYLTTADGEKNTRLDVQRETALIISIGEASQDCTKIEKLYKGDLTLLGQRDTPVATRSERISSSSCSIATRPVITGTSKVEQAFFDTLSNETMNGF